MATKQPLVAVCSICGSVSHDLSRIGKPCGKMFDRKRCKGTYGSALSFTDWAECTACGATGKQSGKGCEVCQGTGWSYVRKTR